MRWRIKLELDEIKNQDQETSKLSSGSNRIFAFFLRQIKDFQNIIGSMSVAGLFKPDSAVYHPSHFFIIF